MGLPYERKIGDLCLMLDVLYDMIFPIDIHSILSVSHFKTRGEMNRLIFHRFFWCKKMKEEARPKDTTQISSTPGSLSNSPKLIHPSPPASSISSFYRI